jgi:hypothetical protein
MGHAAETLAPPPSGPRDAHARLAYADQIERDHPGYLAALGMTAEQYAHELAQPGMSVEESVAAGWMSAAEGRFLLGQATLDDLLELGHSLDEARAMLAQQR